MEDRWELSAEQSPGFGPIAERFRRAGELDRAVALCREGLSKFPNHLSGRVTLGWALLDLGRYDEARVELERVIKRAPDNLAAIRGLAELHDREEHTEFVPMDTSVAWPPKPDQVEKPKSDPAEKVGPVTASAWRDPDAVVTEAARSTAPAVPVVAPEEELDDLPTLVAELEPVSALEPPATATEVLVALESVESSATDSVVEADELEPLQAVMAELNASNAVPEVEPAITVADLAANDSADLDAALMDLTRSVEPGVPSGAKLDASDATAELTATPSADPELQPFEMTVLEAPAVDIFAGVDEPELAALTDDLETDPDAVEVEAALELAANESVDPLLEAAAAVEVMALPVEEPAALAESKPIPVPAVDLVADDLPLRVTAEVSEAEIDAPLDPAVFELAQAASGDHASPNVELLRDQVFDLDPDLHVDMPALAMAAADFPNPEPAAAPLASAPEAAHDLHIEIASFVTQSDHLSRELLESMIVAAAPRISDVPDSQHEHADTVSQAYASALDGRAEFASPQVPHLEASEADSPVVVSPLPPPVADSNWSEPELPSAEAQVPDPLVVAEAAVAPEPEPVVASEPAAKRPRPAPRPVDGLQRFLKRAEGRKAKLARHSAA